MSLLHVKSVTILFWETKQKLVPKGLWTQTLYSKVKGSRVIPAHPLSSFKDNFTSQPKAEMQSE